MQFQCVGSRSRENSIVAARNQPHCGRRWPHKRLRPRLRADAATLHGPSHRLSSRHRRAGRVCRPPLAASRRQTLRERSAAARAVQASLGVSWAGGKVMHGTHKADLSTPRPPRPSCSPGCSAAEFSRASAWGPTRQRPVARQMAFARSRLPAAGRARLPVVRWPRAWPSAPHREERRHTGQSRGPPRTAICDCGSRRNCLVANRHPPGTRRTADN
jgi:hypothetical protein